MVDNASTDQSVSIIQEDYPQIQLICNDYNYGFAGGMNVGLRQAVGEIIVLLNPDTVVFEDWLQAIVQTFDKSEIGIVGCKAFYPDSTCLQHAGATVNPVDAFTTHLGQSEEDDGRYDKLSDADYVTGAAFAIHRRVIEKVGLLEEQFYPAFYEEIDYCYRARNAGFRVVFQHEAALYHHETPSLSTQSYQKFATFHRNRLYFVLRHWSMDAFERFVLSEREALAVASLTDEVMARRDAYWQNICLLPTLYRQRNDNAWLGEPLTKGGVYRLRDELLLLRTVATQRFLFLVQQSTAVAPAAHGMGNPADGPPIADANRVTDGFEQLQVTLQEISEQHILKEYQFNSSFPILGKLFAGFRSLWLSVAARWYVRPVIHQQSGINAKLIQALSEMTQIMQRQQQQHLQQSQLLSQQSQSLSQQNKLLSQQLKQRLEEVQNMAQQMEVVLQRDDAVAVQAMWTLLEQEIELNYDKPSVDND